MRAKDKLRHAERCVGELYRVADEYMHDCNANTIDNFRYQFSNFLSAGRSVTFVLQKDGRNKYGKRVFDQWYEQAKIGLASFSNFVKMRNEVEKEGNRYPLSVNSIQFQNGVSLDYTFDHSEEGPDGMITMDLRPGTNSNIGFEAEMCISGDGSGIDYSKSELTEEQFEARALETFTREFPGMVRNLLESEHSLVKRKFRLLGEEKDLSLNEVTHRCQDYVKALKQLVQEASDHNWDA